MAKEKTEFEIFANTLKAMNKQCTAKIQIGRAALTAVFIRRETELAYACDGLRLAILDMHGHMDPDEIAELAFFADMQSIEYSNGFALVSAKKKEFFVKNCGEGIVNCAQAVEDMALDYPNIEKILPKTENLLHVSTTGAVFLPSNICAIDKVVTAAEKNDFNSVAVHLYGEKGRITNEEYPHAECMLHVAFYGRLLVGLMPINFGKNFLEEVPTRGDYFDAIRWAPDSDPENIFAEDNDKENEDENE